MARIGDNSVLHFDTGISTVHRADMPQHLPDEGVAPALETQPVQLLDALYEMPGFDQRLLAAAAPEIMDRGVLDPAVYAAALREGYQAIAALADAARVASPGADRAALAEALAVLDAAEDVRLVLETAARLLMRA
jgi:hypothetical protein